MSTFPTRRIFLRRIGTSCAALAAGLAQAQSHVEETDDGAVALGYRHDTTQVDGKKYATHQPDQKCSGCQFWQGTPSDAWAGCSMFGRKQISATGWCVAYKKIG
jgi:hypothetical protein